MGETGCRTGAVSLAWPGGAGAGAEVAEDAKPVEVEGCKSGGSGGTRGCIVFEQWPLLVGRQLVQGLLALAQAHDLHFPPALQRQQIVISLHTMGARQCTDL